MESVTLSYVSKHLTQDVIDEVFKRKMNSNEDVTSVEVTRAAPAGEGMLSAVYRIKLTSENHTVTLIAKGLVQDTLLRRSLSSTKFFEREALFFSKILPVLIETQKELGAKECIQNCLPICYGTFIDGENDYILMEDLSVRELKPLPKHPTKFHRDVILKVLGHFHSVSLALRVKKPDVFSNITNGLNEVYFNNGNKEWYAKYLQSAINIDKNVLAEIEGTDGEYYKKFVKFLNDDPYDQLISLTSTWGDHPTINHGDVWYPNFLIFNENAVTFDFQIVRCASPATDLSYFTILCSNLCSSKEDFFEAVRVYHEALQYFLKDMGIDANEVLSLDMLKEELKKFGKFGLLAATTSIPLMSSERIDVLQTFETLSEREKIPLEELWKLSPIAAQEDKLRLVKAVRVAVDVGLI